MMVTFHFDSMAELADHLEAKAKGIRSRVPNASKQSQHVMRAEAHAYEQSAMVVRNAVIAGTPEKPTCLHTGLTCIPGCTQMPCVGFNVPLNEWPA